MSLELLMIKHTCNFVFSLFFCLVCCLLQFYPWIRFPVITTGNLNIMFSFLLDDYNVITCYIIFSLFTFTVKTYVKACSFVNFPPLMTLCVQSCCWTGFHPSTQCVVSDLLHWVRLWPWACTLGLVTLIFLNIIMVTQFSELISKADGFIFFFFFFFFSLFHNQEW